MTKKLKKRLKRILLGAGLFILAIILLIEGTKVLVGKKEA